MKRANNGWSCRIVRLWGAVAATPPAKGGLGHRHLAGCAACQRWAAANDELATALRRDARRTNAVPPDLTQGIMQAVRSSRVPANDRSASARAPWALVAAVTCLAATVALWTQWHATDRAAGEPTVAVSDTAVDSAQVAANGVSTWSGVVAPITDVIKEESLEAEAKSVYADAQSAVRFLALNFLPTAAERDSSDAPRRPARG